MRAVDTLADREAYSDMRLKELRKRVSRISSLRNTDALTIYAAGSYGRLEASEGSDIDLFFLFNGESSATPYDRTETVRLFSEIIKVADAMEFPEFSNGGEFLELLYVDDMLQHLGGREDDSLNHFTSRMLLLLESKPVFREECYKHVVGRVIEASFRDYPDHPATFRPTFLANDITRFWKTLCLNYEHKRNQPNEDPEQRLKQKIKNFKLKFSRMTTCFATVAALSSFGAPVTQEQIAGIVELTPRQRLQHIRASLPDTATVIDKMLQEYSWFLELTGLSKEGMVEFFRDKQNRSRAFERASAYGDLMYELLCIADEHHRYLRFLVI